MMRRTELKRRKGLARGKLVTKSTGFKPRAPIKRRPARYPGPEEKAARKEWEKKQKLCHVCRHKRGKCTHHIAFRSFAPGRWERRCNWLWVCDECHRFVHLEGTNKIRYLLDCKAKADPDNASDLEFCEMIRRPLSFLKSDAAK